jgi:hypothetical protein
MGLPVSSQPFMGSRSLSMPETIQPQGVGENILKAWGEQIPAMLPATGIASRTAPLFNTALQAGRVATGAGVGSGIARTIAPGNPYLDMAAQIMGGLTPSMVKRAINVLPRSVETSMMERAMKPSTVVKQAERTRRVETALEEGIPLTKAGLAKRQELTQSINQEIQDKINQLNVQGAKGNLGNIIAPAENLKATEISRLGFPTKPTQDVQGVIDEFVSAHTPPQTSFANNMGNVRPPVEIPIRNMQNYKQSINKELDDFYNALRHSPDKTAMIAKQWTNRAKVRIADGLRAEISDIFPEIRTLNEREASLIQLNKSLETAVNRISQHDIWSLKGVIALVTHPRYAVMNYILNNPSVQSNLAIAIRQARTKPIGNAGVMGETFKLASESMEE